MKEIAVSKNGMFRLIGIPNKQGILQVCIGRSSDGKILKENSTVKIKGISKFYTVMCGKDLLLNIDWSYLQHQIHH